MCRVRAVDGQIAWKRGKRHVGKTVRERWEGRNVPEVVALIETMRCGEIAPW